MKNTILYGNGINMLSGNNGSISWNDLLKKLSAKFGVSINIGRKPYTMIYEELLLRSNVTELDLKQSIVAELNKFKTNEFYDYMRDLNLYNYITTNYDVNLENSFNNKGYSVFNTKLETIYSIRTHIDVIKNNNSNKIWHIHGDIDRPISISLGLDHYCGTLGKMDKYFKGSYSYNSPLKSGDIINIQASLSQKIKGEEKFDNISWIELFFSTDIHIVGLSLDYSETDLWWLLNRRARTLNCSPNNIHNKIVYYDAVQDDAGSNDKKELLESYNVEYRKYPVIGDNWDNAYRFIFKDIRIATSKLCM